MRHLVLLLTLASALGASAQTGLVEFPYNPDADGNDIIGTADLMELLAVFGDEFSEEGLYLSEDSTTALLYMGEHTFQSCSYTCSHLPGNWAITDFPSLHLVMDELNQLLPTAYGSHRQTWVIDRGLKSVQYMDYYYNNPYQTGWRLQDINGDRINLWDASRCYCLVQEIPKVEYSLCEGQSTFLDCVDEKVSQGWYPLGVGSEWYQAFWRWAE